MTQEKKVKKINNIQVSSFNPAAKTRPYRHSCVGSSIVKTFDWVFDDKKGYKVPKESKDRNFYEEIQASKSSTDIAAIVARAKAGDLSVINVKQPIVAEDAEGVTDLSQLPNTFNDAMNLQINAFNQFSALDPKIRAAFDNDVTKFASAVSDGSYTSIINDYFKVQEPKAEPKKEGE